MLITTSIVSFCKNGGGSVNVKLWFLVVYVRCNVVCHFVVAGNVTMMHGPTNIKSNVYWTVHHCNS